MFFFTITRTENALQVGVHLVDVVTVLHPLRSYCEGLYEQTIQEKILIVSSFTIKME